MPFYFTSLIYVVLFFISHAAVTGLDRSILETCCNDFLVEEFSGLWMRIARIASKAQSHCRHHKNDRENVIVLSSGFRILILINQKDKKNLKEFIKYIRTMKCDFVSLTVE